MKSNFLGYLSILSLILFRSPWVDDGQNSFMFVQSELEPYVEDFFAAAKNYDLKKPRLLRVLFGATEKIGPRYVGYCFPREGTIWINELWWTLLKFNKNEGGKQALIDHELGHCELDLAHDTTISKKGDPESLMNPDALSGKLYLAEKAHYRYGIFRSFFYGPASARMSVQSVLLNKTILSTRMVNQNSGMGVRNGKN